MAKRKLGTIKSKNIKTTTVYEVLYKSSFGICLTVLNVIMEMWKQALISSNEL